jgi:hypothetical protein
MGSILDIVSRHVAEWVFFLAVAVVALAILLVTQQIRFNRFRRAWSGLMQDASGRNIELLLEEHLRERMGTDAELQRLDGLVRDLNDRMATSKRHLGLVRYDAFDDVGGAQSFALALFDERGDGAVVTSLIGRTDCRVYCKPLLSGRSERSLSQEEQRAIEEAKQRGSRPIVS